MYIFPASNDFTILQRGNEKEAEKNGKKGTLDTNEVSQMLTDITMAPKAITNGTCGPEHENSGDICPW